MGPNTTAPRVIAALKQAFCRSEVPGIVWPELYFTSCAPFCTRLVGLAQALTLCFARETITIVDNLGLSADQRGSVVSAIHRYVQGQVNESVERQNFRKRVQHPGETCDDFLVSLRDLSKTCKFFAKECTRKNICDQIIEGLLEGDTVEDLLQEQDLSLDTAISKCRAQEAARKQRADITSGLDGAQIRVGGKRQTENTTDSPQRPCAGCGTLAGARTAQLSVLCGVSVGV